MRNASDKITDCNRSFTHLEAVGRRWENGRRPTCLPWLESIWRWVATGQVPHTEAATYRWRAIFHLSLYFLCVLRYFLLAFFSVFFSLPDRWPSSALPPCFSFPRAFIALTFLFPHVKRLFGGDELPLVHSNKSLTDKRCICCLSEQFELRFLSVASLEEKALKI